MNRQSREAIRRLTILLEQENALLAATDYARISDRLDEKRRLIAELESSRSLPEETDTEDDRTLARRLNVLAVEHRTALECALKVQDQIMAVFADAARRMHESSGYGSRGHRPASKAGLAFALVVRA
jgi:hypothetical protein